MSNEKGLNCNFSRGGQTVVVSKSILTRFYLQIHNFSFWYCKSPQRKLSLQSGPTSLNPLLSKILAHSALFASVTFSSIYLNSNLAIKVIIVNISKLLHIICVNINFNKGA